MRLGCALLGCFHLLGFCLLHQACHTKHTLYGTKQLQCSHPVSRAEGVERFGNLLSSANSHCFWWAACSCASYASDKRPDLQTQCTAVDGPIPDTVSAANTSSRDWPVSGAELHSCIPGQQQYWGLRGLKQDTKHAYCRPAADQDEADVY